MADMMIVLTCIVFWCIKMFFLIALRTVYYLVIKPIACIIRLLFRLIGL